jgi:hypothetical protein
MSVSRLTDHAPDVTDGNFLQSIDIAHGPDELLFRFFSKANFAAQQRGVYLSLNTFEDLAAANRRNSATWAPLIPIFDPTGGEPHAKRGVSILGRNLQGDIVTTIAVRLFDWPTTSFHDEATSLRLFYTDPAGTMADGETCEVTARTAQHIGGHVAFVGAGWFRKDYRGRALSGILSRLARAYAYTTWGTEFTTGFVMETLLKARNSSHWNGFTNIELAVDWRNSRRGDARFGLTWMEPRQLTSDLQSFVSTFRAEIDPIVEVRSA